MAELVDPSDVEPAIELFDAFNIEHARKLALALWAVEVEIAVVDAPPAERWTMCDAAGKVVGHSIVTGAERMIVPGGARIATANGQQLSLGERCDVVPMREVRWVAMIGGQRYGNAVVVPVDVVGHATREIAANMVQTMLAMVVNGTIGRAPIVHDNGGN